MVRRGLLACAVLLVLAATDAFAQTGTIAGVARDAQGGAMPGVTVVVSSPALIEKTRTAVTDNSGRYQIASLPVGVYTVRFSLDSFSTFERAGVEVSSDFSANVNAEMKVGQRSETVTVVATTPTVDIQNATQRQVFTGAEIRDLPTTRDLRSLVDLVPGISVASSGGAGNVQQICSGGGGGFVDSIFGAAFSYTASGALSGCTPILDSFNSRASMNDPASLNQGRIQVDGMSIQGVGGGGSTRYMADVANAAEVTFTMSGALGDSETGGATINIVPRTGGNRYSGNFFTSYSNSKYYDRNNGTRTSSWLNLLEYDYDVNASYGGPILRDRLWFFTSPKQRARSNLLTDAFRNANVGIPGANYRSDTSKGNLGSTEMFKSASLRLTAQASQRNKFNIFWDEQYTCQNPCEGITTAWTSEEAQGTNITQPFHIAQLSWTNPLANRILLDAGVTHNSQHRDSTQNRFVPTYPDIPKVFEQGNTVQQANSIYTMVTSGSLNGETYLNEDIVSSRASVSYVTGNHNIKLGYDGRFTQQLSSPRFNDMRLQYNYNTPALRGLCVTNSCLNNINSGAAASNNAVIVPNATNTGLAIETGCYQSPEVLASPPRQLNAAGTAFVDRGWCGSINLPGNPNNLNDPTNSRYLPVPTSVTMYIPNERKERVNTAAIYLQDQWTLRRLTLNGALRYDNARSRFLETCIGPDVWIPNTHYCVNSPDAGEGKNGQGVSFQDITPRFGMAWDVFGNGKTSVKFNLGKYLGGAGIGGVYSASNIAGQGRFLGNFQRNWTDLDGDRIVDCDLTLPAIAPGSSTTSIPANGECGEIPAANMANYRRFGRGPDELDENNLTIGLGEIQCGRKDSSRIPAAAGPYCDAYYAQGGGSLLNGWNRRRYEWQLGFGVQHEILPRLSAEVTYNRRSVYNATLSDDVGVGCDLYGPTANDPDACIDRQLNWQSEWYDFYAVQAPLDPRLPGGGGYLIPGFADRKPGTTIPSANQVTVQTLDKDHRIKDIWRGVDVNVTLRARGGLRLNGGTSTGSRFVDQCRALIDQADITGTNAGAGTVLWEGRERSCAPDRPFQTNVRGTATYTIPWVDVLASTTFSYRPGAFVSANYTVPVSQLIWLEGSEYRATYGGPGQECPATNVGCLVNSGFGGANSVNTQSFSRNLLGNDTTGEGIRLFDVKLAKNVRFGARRVNVGMDIYNVFNSDAAVGYCTTFPDCGTNTYWMRVSRITAPRYARFQVQVDF